MDAKEKVIALKKAYADIILNISKEAAARVMSSERRAVQYQHELKVAKEEALRMLLHLKQMMDTRMSSRVVCHVPIVTMLMAPIYQAIWIYIGTIISCMIWQKFTNEAEAATLNQQKKIEELEAQLEEAEDIVRDLREELGQVQAELEILKKTSLQNVNEPDYSSGEVPTTVHSYESSKLASEITMSNSNLQNECSKCYYSKKDCMCTSNIRTPDLPSIVSRDNYKDPGLYRNGCTQRIRACERNMLDKDKELCLGGTTDLRKDKNNKEEQEEDGFTRKAPSIGAKTRSELENKLLADIKLSSFQPFRRKRKRATKQRGCVTCLNTKLTDLPQKTDELPEVSTRLIHVSVKVDAQSSESPSTIAPLLSQDEGERKIYQGFEVYSDGSVLQKDEGLNEKTVSLEEETEFVESLLPPVCKGAVEKDDAPSNSLDCTLYDVCERLPSQPVRERIIKYTFQRKHKRGIPNESKVTMAPEMEKRNVDKNNAHKNQELSKDSLLSESSRDSRRLAQVARQLISLSEKKWWN